MTSEMKGLGAWRGVLWQCASLKVLCVGGTRIDDDGIAMLKACELGDSSLAFRRQNQVYRRYGTVPRCVGVNQYLPQENHESAISTAHSAGCAFDSWPKSHGE